MAAYAVVARIDPVKPHRAGCAPPAVPAWPAPEPADPPEAIELVGRPLVPTVAERWTGLRETWSQTTFYLFHAEGWR
jgi:hypothetical protein